MWTPGRVIDHQAVQAWADSLEHRHRRCRCRADGTEVDQQGAIRSGRLYEFLAPVEPGGSGATVQSLTAAPSSLLSTHASANGWRSSSRARCAGFSLGTTRCAMKFRNPRIYVSVEAHPRDRSKS